jgi:acyl-CoA synthetase (AMP-forming)/AMP-acid ligase II
MSVNLANILRDSAAYPREFRIIAELPKGPTGTVLKTKLREM